MSKPPFRLPSLDLMRGFVAVGRRMSISLAAEELCLTQSAVSRQIQALERALGVKLLIRGHRSLAFTPEGDRLFQAADLAVGNLAEATEEVMRSGRRRPVTLTASVGVTSLWLLPRLARFQAAHPEIEVRVEASNRVVDLAREDMDLAIRYCPAARAPAGAELLFAETLVPVASPGLGIRALTDAGSLTSCFLLEYEDPRRPWLRWAEWLAAAGWVSARPRGMHRFNHYDQTIQACLAGQGVALGRLALVRPLLEAGSLVALGTPPVELVLEHAYWLVRAQSPSRPEVERVAAWLRKEAEPG